MQENNKQCGRCNSRSITSIEIRPHSVRVDCFNGDLRRVISEVNEPVTDFLITGSRVAFSWCVFCGHILGEWPFDK
jgi:hypothetical protein